jgi:hypothetical protein
MLNLSESAVVMTLKTRGGDYGIQVRNQVELHPGFSTVRERESQSFSGKFLCNSQLKRAARSLHLFYFMDICKTPNCRMNNFKKSSHAGVAFGQTAPLVIKHRKDGTCHIDRRKIKTKGRLAECGPVFYGKWSSLR